MTVNGIEIEITIVIGIVIGIVTGIGTEIETGDSVSMIITITPGGKTMMAAVIDAIDAHFNFAA